jgi:hypothetical protein
MSAYENTNYIKNYNALQKSLSTIDSDYGFTYFTPTINNVTDISKCFTPYKSNNAVTNTKLNLKDISYFQGPNSKQVFHTNNSCKLNASILQSKKKMNEQINIAEIIKNGNIKNGLYYEILNDYYADDTKYFVRSLLASNPQSYKNENPEIIYKGISVKFDNINNSINNSITDPNYSEYTVQWSGFFKPSISGVWTFSLSNNNASYLWVGDIAINDFNNYNAFVNNGKLHNFITKSNNVNMSVNRYYPIRIIYGNKYPNDKFSLSIVGPNNIDGTNLLYTLYNKDGTLFEKSLLYYSLTEINPDYTNKGLYNCNITDSSDIITQLQLKQDNNWTKDEIVWSLFNENIEGNNINSGNYLSIDANGIISVFNSSGQSIKSLYNGTTSGGLLLDDNGVLSVITPNGNQTVSQSNSKLGQPMANNNLAIYKYRNKVSNTLQIKENSILNSSNSPFLISSNNVFKLSITSSGNLVLYQTTSSCNNVKVEQNKTVHYTAASYDNSQYLYQVNSDEKMNNLFMVNNQKNENSLLPIEVNQSNTISTKSYNFYRGYYPGENDIPLAKKLSQKQCEETCNNDAECKYYYSYVSSDKNNYCITKNDSYFPNQLIPKQPNNDMKYSKLYVRNNIPKLNDDDPRSKIKLTNTSNYTAFVDHQLLADKEFIIEDPKNIGYNGLNSTLQKQLITNWNYQKGKGQPLKETFDNYGYQTSNNVGNVSANAGDSENLPQRIIDKQINPMIQISQDYSNLQQNINNNYYDISNSLYKITNADNSGIRDILSNDPKNIYDFSGNYLNYYTKKPKKEDALKEDVNIMVLEENNLLMLGTITIASLIIGSIYFSRE